MPLTTDEILNTLDHRDLISYDFITLNHPYVYTIDSRLNVFSDNAGKWAVVSEVLGFNPRGGVISLELRYFGNCVKLIKTPQGTITNSYELFPIDFYSQVETIDGEALMPDAAFWLIRGKEIPLSQQKQDYIDADIELQGYEPGNGEIRLEEVGRLLITQYQDILRAADEELFKYLPNNLEKVLVVDEWYHKEFSQFLSPINDLTSYVKHNPEMKMQIEAHLQMEREQNELKWQDRPSTYETWQQIAEVIVSGDASRYNPRLAPNSHWRNWPESGAL
jgi:hypothetical protein